VIVRTRWRPGPEASAAGDAVLVSATIFVYGRFRDFARVSFYGWRLRRAWPNRRGSIGLLTGADARRRTTYTVSAWTGEEALRHFLRAPDHAPLMREFAPKLVASGSVTWETDEFSPEDAWALAQERLRR
jgi:hypothetical protein